MISKKAIMPVIFIFLIGTGGVGASFALSKLVGHDPQPQPQSELTTRFFVINESEIVFGKPAFYSILIENHEIDNVTYELKARMSGQEIYNKTIKMNGSDSLNLTIKLNPNISGGYQKLEFLLYKGNEIYKTRVFQVLPEINYSLAPNLTVPPPSLQNSDMEKDISWKFYGKEFTGNYTTSDWSSLKRSYQIKTLKATKASAFGSLVQNFSSGKEGFASLSFDVKSNNASYFTQALVNGDIVWENSSGKDWKRVRIPVFLKISNTLEFKVIAKNDTKFGITSWWDNIKFENYSSFKIENIKREQEEFKPYTKQQRGNIIVYKFNSGEKLELKVSKDTIDKGNGIYTTTVNRNNIIFLGETYEKVLPSSLNYLYPVAMDGKNKKLKINETLQLKYGYSVTLKQINNQTIKLKISLNNKTVRDIISKGNSSIEYWRYRNQSDVDDYKKYKVVQINPRKINQNEIIFDINQYGDPRVILFGSKYGDFQVTNITENTITLKNNKSLKLEAGKVLSLMGGRIKINV